MHSEEFADSHSHENIHQYSVIRRNGKLSNFDPTKITAAMTKTFLAVEGEAADSSDRIHQIVNSLTTQVVDGISRHLDQEGTVHIEQIQDQVELALMRGGYHKIARAYVLYREEHANLRANNSEKTVIHVKRDNGQSYPLNEARLRALVTEACANLDDVNSELILEESLRNLFDGINEADINHTLLMSARSLIEKEPNYSYVAARLLLEKLRTEACKFLSLNSVAYKDYFEIYIDSAIKHELLNPRLAELFDLKKLANAIVAERDLQFSFLGLQTLYDRYFLHWDQKRFELPQAFFMRVAMGLSLNEPNPNNRAIEFYNLLSKFDFMSSTPTLFNSGTLRSQMSSCYLSTVPDDLDGIFNAIKDNALLSKFAGGLGNDWTSVRGMGAHIKSTNGKSQGVVPFLKVANDTLVAVNQGGRRRGSGCAYLETWHIDIDEFLELRKNTGDERRRAHDMNTANWIPDEFMVRVHENKEWTLFSPDEVPNLHELYGEDFKAAYEKYEAAAEEGKIKIWKRVSAVELWRKMLTMLFETGHPWICFKDPCNIRSPQQHVGVVHSSNLCTEITLNTKANEEVSVCNLGSVNLAAHIKNGQLNKDKLQATISTAMRMLDNVIDLNYYPIESARTANLRHRPVGLGLMGFQDALYQLRIPYASKQAIEFADHTQEIISYYAISASSDLAAERGSYSTFDGSLWSQGILPIDSIKNLATARGKYLQISTSSSLDWNSLRERVKKVGMRNSNTMAIAPTATISNVCGVTQSIEPTYQNLYVKSNLSGEFTVINPYLVQDLKKLKLWDEVMINDLKFCDGRINNIERIPSEIRNLYATSFEIETSWLIEAASRRQKWIDQAQSLNLYMLEPSGRKLDQLYKFAWLCGLKTTYYLRTMGATRVAKNTVVTNTTSQVCGLDDGECDVCQ
jgi:ribonucleoside-diphosphate reductase alpha chain